ncbi:TATA box-binding-like protein 1 [Dinothrombium tinctorium]|uniref:TATA box-binding protein-like 1 n=1 Tax=Dinothrombium tinctorium TaxID=1965070 RepID=A0A3S3Q9X7_9ACAR|nr:TATA box-binding-like protein 1 [Dinothrombium tinctorium]RWS16542.1 TATA box-binding-like protein 1 [Dinothrombium tinctorium]
MLTSAEYNCNNHLGINSEEGSSSVKPQQAAEEEINEEDTPEVDININNVVCNFSTRCHLNLRQIALNGANVVYKRDQGMISMKLRRPKVTASIWSSGKITVTGATSEEEAKKGGRRLARVLQKMGFKVKFSNYRIVNVLGSVILPFGIKIAQFTEQHRNVCSYEPELHPGATYRLKEHKATLKIFQTGAITITAPSVTNVQLAVEYIYPLVYDFKKDKPKNDAHFPVVNASKKRKPKQSQNNKRKRQKYESSDEDEAKAGFASEEEEFVSEESEEDLDPDYYSDKSDQ